MIGNEIKKARKAKNLTQQELAEITGISRNAIVNYERGYRVPTFEILLKLWSVLDINLDEFPEFEKKVINQLNQKSIQSSDKFLKNFKIENLLFDSNNRYVITTDDEKFGEFKTKLKIIDDTTGEWIELTDEEIKKLYNDTLQYFDFLLKKILKQKQGD